MTDDCYILTVILYT